MTPGLGEEGTLLERVMRHRALFPEPSMPPRGAEDSKEAGVRVPIWLTSKLVYDLDKTSFEEPSL